MTKLKHLHFYDELYLHHFVFVLNVASDKQLDKILKERYPAAYEVYKIELAKDKDLVIAKVGGFALTNDAHTGTLVVVVKQKKDSEFSAILAHECFHAVSHVFNARGVEYDPRNDASNEHFAYYLSHLIDKALK